MRHHRFIATTFLTLAGLTACSESAPGPTTGGADAEAAASYTDGRPFEDTMTDPELLSALQDGGYVIYFRHAQTERDYADQVTANPTDCATQRQLSTSGFEQAGDIRVGFTESKIPVAEVIASQYCRAWQTADLAFGRSERLADLNFPPSEEYDAAQVEQMKQALTPLLTTEPPRGKNNVIVGHDDVFDAATGLYPEPQGIAYVVNPDGAGGFELVANVLPEQWVDLAG